MFYSPRLIRLTTGPFACAALLGVMSLDAHAASVTISDVNPEITKTVVDPREIATIENALPEGSNIDASFLKPSYDPFVSLSADAKVNVTFIDEGAGYRNSLGYYAFDQSAFDGLSKSDIDTDNSGMVSVSELSAITDVNVGWVFPNASKEGAGGSLSAGDMVALGGGTTFDAGTQIGFFLTQNTYNGSDITLNEGGSGQDPVFYSNDFLNPEAAGTMTIDDRAEGSERHVALMFVDESLNSMVLAFEDLHRTMRGANDHGYSSDEDFNDAVFKVTSTPEDAIQGSNAPTAPAVPLPAGVLQLLAALGVVGAVSRRRRARA